MKVYVSADIEGVTGVTHWDETDLSKAESNVFREQMTAEVVAACEGAIHAGADEILVKDAHGFARNIFPARLPRQARLIRGWSKHPLMMMQELDETFQAVILVGYHSRAGVGTSPLAHTMTDRVVYITLNDRFASEFLISFYTASYFQVPVVFVCGDKGLCDEVLQLNPNIETVAVKEGIGDSTINIHPDLAITYIRAGVAKALQSDLMRYRVCLPEYFRVEICYHNHASAYPAGFYPGARHKDAFTIQFETGDYFEVLRLLLFVL